jgi:hypothetical protein
MEQIMRSMTILLLLSICPMASPAGDGTLFGNWTFEPAKSTELALWRSRVPLIEIGGTRDTLLLRTTWMEGKAPTMVDSVLLRPGGSPSIIPTTSAVWPDNWLMGVLAKVGTPQEVSAAWEPEGGLRITSVRTVSVSQGEATITTIRLLRLDATGDLLTITEQRSSRPTPVTMVFTRSAAR